MAVVATVIPMTSTYRPFERPPEGLTLWSAIPRGLQSFVVPGTALDAKPAGDEQTLSLTATLPPNFGYVLMDYSVSIAQDAAAKWADEINLNLQNFFIAPESLSIAMSHTWTDTFPTQGPDLGALSDATVRNTRHLAGFPLPSFPMYAPVGVSGILINIQAHNDGADVATAGTVNAYISFWQFDLEQIRKYPINSPFPTHAR